MLGGFQSYPKKYLDSRYFSEVPIEINESLYLDIEKYFNKNKPLFIEYEVGISANIHLKISGYFNILEIFEKTDNSENYRKAFGVTIPVGEQNYVINLTKIYSNGSYTYNYQIVNS